MSLLLAGSTLITSAQDGDFLLTHKAPRLKDVDNLNFNLVHDKNGMMLVANRNGVLKFDGLSWDFFATPSTIFSISIGPYDQIYLGCRDGFGKMSVDKRGVVHYQSLSNDLPDSRDIFQSLEVNGKIFFLNEESLFLYNPRTESVEETWKAPPNGAFSSLSLFKDRILIDEVVTGILEIKEDSLVKSTLNTPDGGLIYFLTPNPAQDEYILGTSEDNLFRIKEKKWIPVGLEGEEDFLHGSEFVDGIWISDSLLALGTLNAGCLFINPYTGKLVQAIDYYTGLPDNEIFAMAIDLDRGIWLAHEFGFTRVAPELPIRSFTHYPGLEGNLLEVLEFNNKIYLATSLGVFFLEELKSFKDIIYYEKIESSSKKERSKEKTKPKEDQTPEKEETEQSDQPDPPKARKKSKKKKGLFGFLKKKDTRPDGASQPAKTSSSEHGSDETEGEDKQGFFGSIFGKKRSDQEVETTKYERKIFKELQSIRFIYQPVHGIQAKVRQLVPFKNRILAGTNQGIFELKDTSAVLISESPARFIYASDNLDLVLVSTMNEQLLTFKLEEGAWNEVDVFPYFSDLIQHINEDADNNLWLAGSDSVYRITFFENDSLTFRGYNLRNDFFDQVYILNLDKKVYFVNSTGYYYYDDSSDILVADSLLVKNHGHPNSYLFNPPDFLWVYNGKVWDIIGKSPSQDVLDYLKLFNNISYLFYQDGSNDLWVVTSDNYLYKYDISSPTKYLTNHHLFLKEIRNKEGSRLPRRDLQIQQENSYIIFEFTQPDYLGLQELEYQYLLKGLNKEWSAWSLNNVISFHYLPPGKYSLTVRTRNSFGQVQESDPYAFRVIPPIWRRWWFYLGESIFFGTLLILSFRLNRMKSRNRVLSRVLTFMTLILILEFIETIVESNLALKSSPILDFFIEASIALLILPIEKILRGYLFKKDEHSAKS